MAKAAHTMIRVLDDEQSIRFYKTAFGFRVAAVLDFEAFRLTYMRNDETDFELELTLNKTRKEPYELGDGYGHLAFTVNDIESEHARLGDIGLKPEKIISFAPKGELIAKFFFISDPEGYQIEVIERGGRFQ